MSGRYRPPSESQRFRVALFDPGASSPSSSALTPDAVRLLTEAANVYAQNYRPDNTAAAIRALTGWMERNPDFLALLMTQSLNGQDSRVAHIIRAAYAERHGISPTSMENVEQFTASFITGVRRIGQGQLDSMRQGIENLVNEEEETPARRPVQRGRYDFANEDIPRSWDAPTSGFSVPRRVLRQLRDFFSPPG